MTKPFSQACENNKAPILEQLQHVFAKAQRVLEIGSGTGQHAIYFAENLPHLIWQTSDREENHPGIQAWLETTMLANLLSPLLLDVGDSWPTISCDAVFSANTTHIMAWPEVEKMFQGIGRLLPAEGILAIYGPFNYNGEFTSESNARFEQWLKSQGEHMGLRDIEAIHELAKNQGLKEVEDYAMPANNRLLVWRKS